MILGIDEVGRGPWAGPLVVGAVVLDSEVPIDGLTDSKKLTAIKRVQLAEEIQAKAAAYGLGWVDSQELDRIGLSEALKLATIRAVEQIKVSYHEIVIDGTVNFLRDTPKGRYVTMLKKADLLVPSVSAASILAKVARDHFMYQQDVIYPEYGFATHVGYGTLKHRKAIEVNGLTPLHRRSFAPIKVIVESGRTTKVIGDEGEEKAREFLASQGFNIIESNWRNRWCEIDIIASKDEELYFIEVKKRSSSIYGSALDAVTPRKLKQMTFAASYYIAKQAASKPVRLAVVAIDGENLEFIGIE